TRWDCAPPSDHEAKVCVALSTADMCSGYPAHEVTVVGPVTLPPASMSSSLMCTVWPAGCVAIVSCTSVGLKSCSTVLVTPLASVADKQTSSRLPPAIAENCSALGAANEVFPFPATGSSTGCAWLMWNSHTCHVSALVGKVIPLASVAVPAGVYVLPTVN